MAKNERGYRAYETARNKKTALVKLPGSTPESSAALEEALASMEKHRQDASRLLARLRAPTRAPQGRCGGCRGGGRLNG